MTKAVRIWILTGGAVRAVDQRLIRPCGLRDIPWSVCQRIVVGDLPNGRSVLMLIVMIVVGHLLIVAARHLLRVSGISFRSVVSTLSHPVLLMIVVHAVAVDAVTVRSRIRTRVVLILIVIFLLQLLLHLWCWRDTARRVWRAQHDIAAHQLRRAVAVCVRVVVVVVARRLLILRMVVGQVVLLNRRRHHLLPLLAVIVHVICGIDWGVWGRGWRRSFFLRHRCRLIVRQRFGR